MKAVILGATQGIGRAIARQLVGDGNHVFILGRPIDEVEQSVADLQNRSNAKNFEVKGAFCDLEDPSTFVSALYKANKHLNNFDTVIVTAAMFATQEQLEADEVLAHRLLMVNFTNTVSFCEKAREVLLKQGGGTLCVFSSVAGDRGRKPVGIYGSSKAGLSHYLESLDHKYRSDGLHTVCVKPGFVKTSMTDGLKPPPFAGDPERVAKQVIKAIKKGTPCIYAPPIWRFVMIGIRHTPRFVMRKIGF